MHSEKWRPVSQLDAQSPGELCVADRASDRRALEAEAHAKHDVPGAAPEPARAIGKGALRAGQLNHSTGLAIVGPHRDDRVGDLLPVGADVLDRRGAYEARDARQALDSRQPIGHASRKQVVPRLARRRDQLDAIAPGLYRHAPGEDPQHSAVEPGVGDNQVRPSSDHQEGLAGSVHGGDRLEHLLLALRLDQPAGWPAESERGQLRERNVDAFARAAGAERGR